MIPCQHHKNRCVPEACHRKISCFTLLVCVLLFVSCNSKEKEQELVKLSVGVTPFIGEVATYVAQERGYFTEQGLEVSIRPNRAGMESFQQLLNGDIDIAHIAETPFLVAIASPGQYGVDRDNEPRILANLIHSTQIQKVLAHSDLGLKKPYDLSGLRVGVKLESQSEYHLDSFLLEYQASPEDIEIVNLTPAEQEEAFRNREIDVMVTWEPHTSRILSEAGSGAVELETSLSYSTLWLAVTLENSYREKPEALKAYLRALREAQVYMRNHPGEVVDILAGQLDTNRDIIENLADRIDYELSLSERMLALLNGQHRWLVRRGDAPDSRINVEEMIIFEPMEEVFPEGITLIQ